MQGCLGQVKVEELYSTSHSLPDVLGRASSYTQPDMPARLILQCPK